MSETTTSGQPTDGLIFEVIRGPDITDEHLKACATLFSNHYGVWAPGVAPPLKPGSRVRMTAARLRKECLADIEKSVLVRCCDLGEPVGHACVTKWPRANAEGYVGWVTQLIVEAGHRRRRIATTMLQMLKQESWFEDVTVMGIASSHPAACNSLCNLSGGNTRDVDLNFITENGVSALVHSNIKYLKDAPLRGAFLGTPGGSYSAFTAFFVDHAEPLGILQTYLDNKRWAFGELLDGHEFVVLIPVPKNAKDDDVTK
ncbi:hypothetical protein C8Q78DRAFT_1104353 [Trametes maxima]|nr:hypothetical protein C8Q78DRAFT_1104353 [Trametes maxima]